MRSFALWRTTWLLCGAGRRDEALLCVVASVPFTAPSDPDLALISESRAQDSVIALDENVHWCRVSMPQGERILRLLRSGELQVCVHDFEPNSPLVLSGARARLIPANDVAPAPRAIARRQPAEGFRTPHHVRASLRLGPRADVPQLRRLLTGVLETGIVGN